MTDAEIAQLRSDGVLLHAIVSRTVKLKRAGREWKGLCPFHREKTPSFTVFLDGHFYCFGCQTHGTAFDFLMKAEHVDFPEACRRVAAEAGVSPSKNNRGNGMHKGDVWQPMAPPRDAPPPTAEQLACDMLHEYFGAEENLICYVRRVEAKGGKSKRFLPLTFGTLNGERGWHAKAPSAPRPLYRLNALSHADADATVLLCEGEKAADAAQRLLPDMVAMTWMGGANSDGGADFSPLRGRTVILWPDADQPGRDAMARIARRLPQARVINTDDLTDGYDAADLEHDCCDDPDTWLLARLREPEPVPDPESAEKPVLRLHYGFDATRAEPLGTIVEGILHAGSLTLIYGPPKSGKSFLLSSCALSVAAQDPVWMDHDIVRPGAVLYVTCEGHAGFWKRLVAEAKERGWGEATFPKGFILATGRPMLIKAEANGMRFAPDSSSILVALEDAKRRGLNPVAIVIDTVFRSFGEGNVNASPDMNVYLAAIAALTDQGYAVALVHHEIKSGGTPAGSVSLIGGADTIIHVWRKEDEDGGIHRLWQVEMAKDDAETSPRAFSLDKVDDIGLDPDGRPASSCVVRDGGSSPDAAADKRKKRGRPPSNDSEQAILAGLIHDHLCNLLADGREGQDVSIRPEAPPIRAVSRTRLRGTINQAGILVLPREDATKKDRERTADANDKKVQRAINLLIRQRKVAANEHWIGLAQ